MPGQYRIQRFPPWGHGHIAIDIEANGAGLILSQALQRPCQDQIWDGPTQCADIAFIDGNEDNLGWRNGYRRLESNKPVVGPEFLGIEIPPRNNISIPRNTKVTPPTPAVSGDSKNLRAAFFSTVSQ